MRTELSEMPSSPFEIMVIGNDAQIIFRENAQEVVREQSTGWAVDEYRLTVKNRKGLQQSVEENLQAWMNAAKAAEQTAPPKTVEERVSTVEDVVTAIAEVML